MPTVTAVCVSKTKGTVKESVPEIFAKAGHGIIGDAHAVGGHKQVSLLAVESVDKLREKAHDNDKGLTRDKTLKLTAGAFAENILTKGIALNELQVGTKLKVGGALLEVTQIGKECHKKGCAIKQLTGDCVMPREGIFATVLENGKIKPGDVISYALH